MSTLARSRTARMVRAWFLNVTTKDGNTLRHRGSARRSLSASRDIPPEERDQPHLVARIIAAIFMASAAYQVFPLVPAAVVEHTIKLMRTDQPFLQDAGMMRLQWISGFEPVRRRARELGAVEAIESLDGLEHGRDESWEARRRSLLDALSISEGDTQRSTE